MKKKLRTNNRPEIRHAVILDTLLECDELYNFIITEKNITANELKQLNIHDSRMIDYFEQCYNSFVTKKDNNLNFENEGIVPINFCKQNVEDIIIANMTYWMQSGIWCTDIVTPILKNTWDNIAISAKNSYVVNKIVIKDTMQTIYCLHP